VSRTGWANRCEGCHMFSPLCICSEIPSIVTRTQLVMLLHYAETRLPTNTGWLVHRAIPNSHFLVRGLPNQTSGLEGVAMERTSSAVLFPAEDSIEIGEWAKTLAPAANPTLIVPDGTWRQAKRMMKREPVLEGITRVHLAPGAPSRYRLREEPHPHQVCTIEAVMRALDRLESKPITPQLERVFTLMVERTLWSRGKLAGEAVFEGVPKAALEWGNKKKPPQP
jgi:DTW domain-containing protein YfiP